MAAFAAGALVLALLELGSQVRASSLFAEQPEPAAPPPGARTAGAFRQLATKALPRVVGVSLLAAAVSPFKPVVAAFAGGASVGLALVGWPRGCERTRRCSSTRKTRRLYRR